MNETCSDFIRKEERNNKFSEGKRGLERKTERNNELNGVTIAVERNKEKKTIKWKERRKTKQI